MANRGNKTADHAEVEFLTTDFTDAAAFGEICTSKSDNNRPIKTSHSHGFALYLPALGRFEGGENEVEKRDTNFTNLMGIS